MRAPEARDLPALLALNNAHAAELSLLDSAGLAALLRQAFHARVAGDGADALLISFDQDADYGSPNFLWFRGRHARFVYVDRVVVAPALRRRGTARALYAGLAAAARAAGHDRIGCEVNSDPPNPVSMRFHQALGFRPVGTAAMPEYGKTVAYLELALG